jgi:hypothetical protein
VGDISTNITNLDSTLSAGLSGLDSDITGLGGQLTAITTAISTLDQGLTGTLNTLLGSGSAIATDVQMIPGVASDLTTALGDLNNILDILNLL